MDIATVLKSEVSRLARKELKSVAEGLKKALAKHRAEIAELKRLVLELQRQVKVLSKSSTRERGERVKAAIDRPIRIRFRAKGLAAQRQRLGLSAENFGKLIGVSGQTIYLWEAEKTKPRDAQLQAIAKVRKMGKREAAAALGGEG